MPNRLSNLRISELDSNSTHWDVASASPSDEVLHIQFALLATVNAIVAISCALLIISILLMKKVRQRAFNIYLLSITFPDLVTSCSCLITCAISSASYTFYTEQMCGWQAWYLVWGFTSNCWMNAVIAHEIYTMLRLSHMRGRYDPPTQKKVALQTGYVYLYAAVLASLATWSVSFLPFESGSYQGLACFPKDYDKASAIFFWVVFVPAFMLIPFLYYTWCCVEIIRRGLLPPVGLRRELALYFFRIGLVYFIMWLPFVIITFIARNENTWIGWFGAVWSHTQGFVSVLVSLTKADIKEGFLKIFWYEGMLCVRPKTDPPTEDLDQSQSQQNVPRRRASDHRLASGIRLSDDNMIASGVHDDVVDDGVVQTEHNEDGNTLRHCERFSERYLSR